MYCTKCQKDVAALNGVCPQCGLNLTTTPPSARQTPQPQNIQNQNTQNSDNPYPNNDPNQNTQGQNNSAQQNQTLRAFFPPHIDNLGLPFRLKLAFLLIEKYKMHSPNGIMMSPQDTNKAPTFSEKMEMFSWLTFFFTAWYYIFTGMWRKGLSIFGISIAIAIVFEIFTAAMYTEEELLFANLINAVINIALNIIWAKTAFYDRYRTIVRKEVFWW
ncbi:DUF2628 domain-containing protein [Desulfovibrio litoralis]|uniref:Uncharacterized protein n=1 Tax=Desulfovibrio litoralis DSM 11393 TaxID=1121455 RepID=A0A1M7TF87_9BACT|nr:DUF2628 domain-containing protein [Desulfovibrio litoralis]SHN69321.1 Protein of unknown function [Desulfovibrio litoralis DSM 11393]